MRYIFGLLVAIGLIVLIIFLLLSGNSKPKVVTKPLDSYATTNAKVRLLIDAPINAAQNHQQVQITVDQNSVTFEQLTGYSGQVVNQQVFPNNQTAFAVFLRALGLAGFSDGNTSKSLADERGYCPLGDRYIMDLIQNGNDLERFWSTSCGSPKTYHGDMDLTLSLFEAQVPGYNQLTQNIQL